MQRAPAVTRRLQGHRQRVINGSRTFIVALVKTMYQRKKYAHLALSSFELPVASQPRKHQVAINEPTYLPGFSPLQRHPDPLRDLPDDFRPNIRLLGRFAPCHNTRASKLDC